MTGTARPVLHAATLCAAALTAALLVPAQAQADPCSTGSGGGFGCNNNSPGGGGGGGGGGTGGGGNGGGGGGATGDIPIAPGTNGNLGPGQTNGGGGGAPPPAHVATNVLAQQAAAGAQLPVPVVHTAPAGKTYVGVKTAFWVDGFVSVQTPPVEVPGQIVQATATPAQVTWHLGDPASPEMVCDNAGSKDGATCSHTYQRASTGGSGNGAYQITATISWNIHWTCTGTGCDQPGGDLPAMTMTSVQNPLVVTEIQTGNRQ